jgi:hypothetical protein
MSQARKLRRAAAVKPVPRDDDGMPPMGRVGIIAGISLGLSDDQTTDALNALAGFRPDDATTGTMYARMLELVDLARNDGAGDALQTDLDTTTERAKLERRFGAGFTKRVAAMGSPAVSMLAALRSLLLLAMLLLWPSTAKAASQELAGAYSNAHKIQRRNRRLAARRKVGPSNQAAYYHPWGWIQSSRKSAGLRRLFTSCRSFETGSGRERGSSKSRARSSILSWFGARVASTWGGSPRVTRTSRFNVATERSKAHHTAGLEK